MIAHLFSNGIEAMNYYFNHKEIALILTDLRMPGITGQAVILQVREFEKKRQRSPVPIIVLTAESSCSEKTACIEYGANDYLVKPIRMMDLVESIRRVLTKSEESPKSILLIDDDVISSRVVTIILRKLGYLVKTCTSISQSKSEIEKNYTSYDLILLDSQLLDGTGRDFLEYYSKMISRRSCSAIPIISLSGNSEDIQAQVYSGFDIRAFLTKPVSKNHLFTLLKSIF